MNQDEFSVQGAGWNHLCSLSLEGNLRRAPLGMDMPRYSREPKRDAGYSELLRVRFPGASDLHLPAGEEAQHINLCAPRRHRTDKTLENKSSVRCFCGRVCEPSESGSSR